MTRQDPVALAQRIERTLEPWRDELELGPKGLSVGVVRALARAVLDLAEKAQLATCVYCGHVGDRDGMAEHVMACEKHPWGELIRERDKLIQIATEANDDAKKAYELWEQEKQERDAARAEVEDWKRRWRVASDAAELAQDEAIAARAKVERLSEKLERVRALADRHDCGEQPREVHVDAIRAALGEGGLAWTTSKTLWR